jgi:ribosome-associated protein
MAKIHVTDEISIDENELDERFILAAGPGGQNVNKVASAVELRFDVARSPSLADDARARLVRAAGRRLTKSGELVIVGRRFRTQERNRADVRMRLFDLIRAAAVAPRPRRKTKPPASSKTRRLADKTARGRLKRLRGRPAEE